uniref:Retrotransposon Copia-like N-terminal domain-containing protein n=1 Tax=Cajanus cajan TaxID=3821 RepID=A0A151UBJ5_CAJCA|nr:hypothetical protein KK1_020900 [Cajanus cajan]
MSIDFQHNCQFWGGHNLGCGWDQLRSFFKEKGKEGYIIGDSKSPEKGDPDLKIWQLENNLVMLWLFNTMTNEIGENFMYYDTSKEMWDAVKETYSNVDNTRHWQQLDIYEDVQCSCTEDKKKYK